jgi:Dyp-type peroxidase family
MTNAPTLDREDVQGLIASGYDHLDCVRYVFLRIADPVRARAWLGDTLPRITNAVHPGDSKRTKHLNIAFAWNGLVRLTEPGLIKGFSYEFIAGMTRNEADLILGDTGASARDKWEFGWPRNPEQEIHLLLLIYADTDHRLRHFADQICGPQVCAQRGLQVVFEQEAIRKHHDLFEPFGFRDGISQPAILGLTGRRKRHMLDPVKTGEFLLGHEDEWKQLARVPGVDNWRDPKGYLPAHPECPDKFRAFGTNGTYLVFRKLSQDVAGFWAFVDHHARTFGGNFQHERDRLAARMVGRWKTGAPLVLYPDNPGASTANDFTYTQLDPAGVRCPIGAHIRRANPRDSLQLPPLQSMSEVRRHRIIRRGRKYCKLAAGSTPDNPKIDDQGICFIALNADLRRQFEFVQQTWLNRPTFNELDNDKDPIAGDNDGTRQFSIQQRPVNQHITGLPRFVTVKGGGYFFLPPMSALRFLVNYPSQTSGAGASAPSPTPPTPREQTS